MEEVDTRVNLGLILKGEAADVEALLNKIISEVVSEFNCKYVAHKINSDRIWISGNREDKI